MSTSTDGKKWTKTVRIPIDPVTSTVDHFIPGLAVDRATSGKTAHLTTTYYYYPQASCNDSTCEIHVGFTTSSDGGKTWTAGKDLGAGPMKISWLPASQNGPMLADYLSSSYVNGNAFGVFMVATSSFRFCPCFCWKRRKAACSARWPGPRRCRSSSRRCSPSRWFRRSCRSACAASCARSRRTPPPASRRPFIFPCCAGACSHWKLVIALNLAFPGRHHSALLPPRQPVHARAL